MTEVRHPWRYLQQELLHRGRTQKDFAYLLGKKVSEVNELIKGKRNITVQWDLLLSTLFADPEKKRIHLQIDYDYQKGKELFQQEKQEELYSRKQQFHQTAPQEKEEPPIVREEEPEVYNDITPPQSDPLPVPEKEEQVSSQARDLSKQHAIFRDF